MAKQTARQKFELLSKAQDKTLGDRVRRAFADNGTAITDPDSFEAIRKVLDGIKAKSFVPGYEASDAEALGLLVSKWFKWDGLEILIAAYNALEDANFHNEANIVADLIAAVQNGKGE